MAEEEKIRAVDKSMGEPFGLEFSEDVLKTRRNLLLVGSLSLVVAFAGLSWRENSTGEGAVPYFGVPLKGMSHELFMWLLLAANIYLAIHFIWAAWDTFQEFIIRLTGTRTAFQTAARLAGGDLDYPSDPRQSTLYNWWLREAKGFPKLNKSLRDVEPAIAHFVSALNQYTPDKLVSPGLGTELVQTHRQTAEIFNMLKEHVQRVEKLLDSPRLAASLKRFDEAFTRRSLSQCWRWIVLEFGLPTLLGIAGAAGLIYRLFTFYFSS